MKKILIAILFLIIFGICLVLPRVGAAGDWYCDVTVGYQGEDFNVCGTYLDSGGFFVGKMDQQKSTLIPDAIIGVIFSIFTLPDGTVIDPSLKAALVRGSTGMGFVPADCEFKHDLTDYPVACCGYEVKTYNKLFYRCMMPPLTSKNWTGFLYVDKDLDFLKELAPCCLIDKILTIGDYIFVGLLIVAIIVILLAAWMFLTAAGEPDKVKNARNYLLYAVIGIAVAFLAQALVKVIAAIIG